LALKILILSDIHNQTTTLDSILREVRQLPEKPEFCFIAGDITNFGSYEDLNHILNTIAKSFRKTYYVLGNCDPYFDTEEVSTSAIHAESAPFKLDDFLTVVGFGDHIPKINYKLLKKLEKSDEKVCLLTHAPPFGTKADMVSFDRHSGSRVLLEVIEKYQCIFLTVSGHIHDSPTISVSDKYTIVNPGPVTRGNYAIISINEDYRVKGHIHNIH